MAGRLIGHGDARTWIAAGATGGGAIGGYVFTRLLSTPLDNQDVGNWACMLGLAALFVEVSLLALSAYAFATGSHREGSLPASMPVEAQRKIDRLQPELTLWTALGAVEAHSLGSGPKPSL